MTEADNSFSDKKGAEQMTKATFSGTKRTTIRVVCDYIIAVGQGNSAGEALNDLENEVCNQAEGCSFTPVGGATVLYDDCKLAWVAYQTFIMYKDEEFEE